MVQVACWLYPCVRDEMHTYMCKSDCSVAAVAIAVDRETADASRGLKWPEESRPKAASRVCRMSVTGLRMLKSVL